MWSKAFCPIRSEDGSKTLSAANGQACFWFSNGCTHGCKVCDGVHANGASRVSATHTQHQRLPDRSTAVARNPLPMPSTANWYVYQEC